MPLEGSYETKLLRILIGFFHVSTLQTLAITRHGKHFHLLTPEEKLALESEMVAAVVQVAGNLDEKTLTAEWKPPPTVN